MKRKTIDLRERRLELGMTIEGVAAAAGISPAMVRILEVGGQRGTLVTRSKIAKALGLQLIRVLSESEVKDLRELTEAGQDKGRAK